MRGCLDFGRRFPHTGVVCRVTQGYDSAAHVGWPAASTCQPRVMLLPAARGKGQRRSAESICREDLPRPAGCPAARPTALLSPNVDQVRSSSLPTTTLATPDVMSGREAGSGTSQSIVFVTGLPCSGTTLVDQFLGLHPEVLPLWSLDKASLMPWQHVNPSSTHEWSPPGSRPYGGSGNCLDNMCNALAVYVAAQVAALTWHVALRCKARVGPSCC